MDFCMSQLPPKVMAITEVDSQIKDSLETEYRYSTLAKLAKAILVIPHANVPNIYSATLISTKNEAQNKEFLHQIHF